MHSYGAFLINSVKLLPSLPRTESVYTYLAPRRQTPFSGFYSAQRPKPRWKVISQSRTSSRETPVTKFVMCSWHEQLPDVVGMRPQRATTSIRQKMTVVNKIRRSSTSERLMHEPRDLERNSLTNWQPVQLPQHWCDVVTSLCSAAPKL